MERSLEHLLLEDHFPKARMACVVGPRQVGKTTLARRLLRERHSADLYRNWDDLEWRRALSRDPYGFVDAFRPKAGTGKPPVASTRFTSSRAGSGTSRDSGTRGEMGSTSSSLGAGARTCPRRAATAYWDAITSTAFILSRCGKSWIRRAPRQTTGLTTHYVD